MLGFTAFLLRRRFAVLGLLLLVTAGFAAVLPRAVIATNFSELFFSKDAAFDSYLRRTHDMTNDHGLFVGLEEAEPLAPAALARLQRAVDAIAALKEVRRVSSLLDAGTLRDDGTDLTYPKFADEARAHPERAAALTQAMAADPMWARTVISADGRHTALIVEILPDESRKAEAETELVAAIHAALAQAGYPPEAVHVGGTSAVTAEMFNQVYKNLTRVFPLVVVVLFGVGFLMFRQVWPVVITMLVAFIAVIWTSGFALLLDPKVNLFMSIVPIIILVISFSDVIHLCSAYLLELGTGKSKTEAILATGGDVGAACLFTSVTTFIGFASLAFVPSPVMRQFGLVLGFGVAATLLIALTLVPVIFALMAEPPRPKRATLERSDLTAKFLGLAERVSLGRPWTVLLTSLLVLAVSAAGLRGLTVDASMLTRLSENNPVRRDAAYFGEHFAGTATLSIFVEAQGGDDLLAPANLRAVAAFQDRVKALPEVNQAVSIVDLIRATHKAMREPDDTAELPGARDVTSGYLMLADLAGQGGFERSLSPDKRTLQIVLRLGVSSFRDTFALGEAVRRLGGELLPENVTAEPAGLLFFMGRWLDELVEGQKRGLLFSFFSIALVMMLGLRSLRNGALSMLPNLLPLLVLGGYVGWTHDRADSDMMIVAMIAIGIAVDDTIHYMMRFRIESRRTADVIAAARETFHFAGRAIVITTVILVAGFVPLVISDYYTFFMFGTLLPLTLVAALLADLFVTPALTALGWIRYPREAVATELTGVH